MWKDMLVMGAPLAEKVLRPIVVYIFLVAALRVFGKRELAQLNPFDLVVLLSLSNTVQNAIIGNDNSLTGGLVGAFAALGLAVVPGFRAFMALDHEAVANFYELTYPQAFSDFA